MIIKCTKLSSHSLYTNDMEQEHFGEKIVVLTAPHSYCSNESTEFNRKCDLLALDAVKCINEKNLEKKGTTLDMKVFLPSIERKDCDLNRDDECALSNPYRLKLTEFVKLNQKNITFVLDVHSFPSTSKEWGSYDILILEDTDLNANDAFSTYSLNFVEFVQALHSDEKWKIGLVRGRKNAIIREMKGTFKLKSFLIEFNEDLKESRLQQICTFIVVWLNSISAIK